MPSDPLSLPLSPESPASPSASIFGDEDEKYNDVYITYTWNFHPGIILDPGLRAWNFEPQIQFQTLMKISDPGMFGVFVI